MKKFQKILNRKERVKNQIIEDLKDSIEFERNDVTQPALSLCNHAEEAINYINYLEQEYKKLKEDLFTRLIAVEGNQDEDHQ